MQEFYHWNMELSFRKEGSRVKNLRITKEKDAKTMSKEGASGQ